MVRLLLLTVSVQTFVVFLSFLPVQALAGTARLELRGHVSSGAQTENVWNAQAKNLTVLALGAELTVRVEKSGVTRSQTVAANENLSLTPELGSQVSIEAP
jgi:hypothetical protein